MTGRLGICRQKDTHEVFVCRHTDVFGTFGSDEQIFLCHRKLLLILAKLLRLYVFVLFVAVTFSRRFIRQSNLAAGED